MGEIDPILNAAARLVTHTTPLLDKDELAEFVESFVRRRDEFLEAVKDHGSPLYILEEDVLLRQAEKFKSAFSATVPDLKVFYAVKTNNNPAVAKALAQTGYGLDVSSGEELKLALDSGASEMVFSGPAKTMPELKLAVDNADRVTVLMDSFGELERLESVASEWDRTVRAGVRLTTDQNGLWRKFGVTLVDIPRFFKAAETRRHVMLIGLQFHVSWNMNPHNQVNFIRRLGQALKDLPEKYREQIEFLDIGGGYWPSQGEWLHPAGTPEGQLKKALDMSAGSPMVHHRVPSVPIETFSREIGKALEEHVFSSVNCTTFAEPGRWVVNDAMHILVTVVDRKADDLVIADAGTNTVGWERYESDYFPVINLTRPGTVEKECMILGSLCTPHDVWGYTYFGEDILPGDVLLIPTQGAYTYSLRQHFIKALPETVVWKSPIAKSD